MKLTKNGDPDKYLYSGYAIGFDTRSHFSWTWGSWGKNVVVFGDGILIIKKSDFSSW